MFTGREPHNHSKIMTVAINERLTVSTLSVNEGESVQVALDVSGMSGYFKGKDQWTGEYETYYVIDSRGVTIIGLFICPQRTSSLAMTSICISSRTL